MCRKDGNLTQTHQSSSCLYLTCSLVLELLLTFSWNLSGILFFNSSLIQNGSYPYYLYSCSFFFSFFLIRNSDWAIFFLTFHWMKQCAVVWMSRIREVEIPRMIPTVFWLALGRSSYCGFLFVSGNSPFGGMFGADIFRKCCQHSSCRAARGRMGARGEW